jgi:hypothetical protein
MVIKTHYFTDTYGKGFIRATERGGARQQLTATYPHESPDPHKAVAWELVQRIRPDALRISDGLMHKTGFLFKVEV